MKNIYNVYNIYLYSIYQYMERLLLMQYTVQKNALEIKRIDFKKLLVELQRQKKKEYSIRK